MNDKTFCERCCKECKHSVYISEIDKNLICFDCWSNEQPKALMKRIKELEEEIKKQENLMNLYKLSCDNYLARLNEKDLQIGKMEEENAKLKGQLKNAPKFELGQDVFIVIDNIEKAKVERIIQTISKEEEECSIWYALTDKYGYALRLPEEQIFVTESEAQKYLDKTNKEGI